MIRNPRFMLLLATLLSWSLTGIAPTPVQAVPTVTVTAPAGSATGVPVSAVVSATFSEPMDPATITSGSVTLSKALGISALAAGEAFSVAVKSDGSVVVWGDRRQGQSEVPAGLAGVRGIAAGAAHVVAVKADGTVVAWGDNRKGQATVPAGLAGGRAVAAGATHSVALKSDGTVVAWGENSRGQASVPAGLAGVKAIAAGGDFSLALKADGTVIAWGDSAQGQTRVPAGLSGVVAIAAGARHGVALKGDGTVLAWGDAGQGQTTVPAGLGKVAAIAAGGRTTMALKGDGTVAVWGDGSQGQARVPAGVVKVAVIAAGSAHLLAAATDGNLMAWGSNSAGQAVVPSAISGVAAVAAGFYHTVALKNDAAVVAWGDDSQGQATVPAGLAGVSTIAAGFYHNVAIRKDGTVVAWGDNSQGQTVVPSGITGARGVAAGFYHTAVVKGDGSVVAWGDTTYGQSTVPAGLAGVTAVAAGAYHSVALKGDGSVAGWGDNSKGQTAVPTGLAGVKAIAAGFYHTVALKSDGSVAAWGDSSKGQTGVPQGLAGIKAIAVGTDHTVALKSDGSVVAWGDNSSGQTSIPAGLTGVAAIAAGARHTVALKYDGTLVIWGDNSKGQGSVPGNPFEAVVAGTVTYSPVTQAAVLTPATPLTVSENPYRARVLTGVRSATGSHPTADTVWSFSTMQPVNGACGTAISQVLASAPTTELCSSGTASAVTGSGPWNWSCSGRSGGSSVSCATTIPHTYRLTVLRGGAGSGEVAAAPDKLVWKKNSGTGTYAGNSVVTLTASPESGSSFAGWSGACSGTGSCQVTMSSAKSVTALFNLSPGPTITVPLPPGTAGTPYSVPLSATGGVRSYVWSLANGSSLPAGLTLDADGVISGTPTAGGSYGFTVQVRDKKKVTSMTSFMITVALPPVAVATAGPLKPGTVGEPYLVALAASGGVSPYSWSVASGSLPPGLNLDTAGTLSGTPLAGGSYSFTLQAADGQGTSAKAVKALTMEVGIGPLSVTTGTLTTGTLGAPYEATLAAAGGVKPYVWSTLSGNLPAGLTLGPGGAITGTPTEGGRFTLTVKVADSQGSTTTATKVLTLDVGIASLTVATNTLANGTIAVPYEVALTATGGVKPYTWWLAAGSSLPSGLTLNPGGAISGIPTTGGSFNLTVKVTDSQKNPVAATKSFTLNLAIPPLSVTTTAALKDGTIGDAYGTPLAATGGVPPYTWSITAGGLPPGLGLNTATGNIGGTPAAGGLFRFTAQVADSQGTPLTTAKAFTLNVAIPALTITSAPTLPAGTVGTPFTAALTATGGVKPYTWTITAGKLPTGLGLDTATGAISGTPARAGSSTFSVQVRDLQGKTTAATFTVNVR